MSNSSDSLLQHFFLFDLIGILAFRRQNCYELVLNILHLSDFFKDFDIFLDRKPHLCCQLPCFPDTEVKDQSPLKKNFRKTLDISDWSRRSESIDFMANISRSYYYCSQPAKHVSVLHDKVQILFAGKLSLRKKIAYKQMGSVFWVVKVWL